MAISRSSSFVNSYRFIRVMIDEYDQNRISGRIYHDSRDAGVEFKSLMGMAWAVEELLDEIQYPMRSTDIRRFKRTEGRTNSSLQTLEQGSTKEIPGALMSFRLMVQYRQNASWQGKLRREDTGATYWFHSFLELIQILDNALTKTDFNWALCREDLKQVGFRQVCSIGIDDYQEHSVSGRLYAKQAEEPLVFGSSIQMAKGMMKLLNNSDLAVDQDKKIIHRKSFHYYSQKGKKATFCIQVLFKEHDSLQGIMYWKERKEQTKFRSFLEMLMLMDAAVNQSATGKNGTDKSVEKVI